MATGNDFFYKVTHSTLVIALSRTRSSFRPGQAEDGPRTTMFENEIVHNELYGINLGIHTQNGQPVPLG